MTVQLGDCTTERGGFLHVLADALKAAPTVIGVAGLVNAGVLAVKGVFGSAGQASAAFALGTLIYQGGTVGGVRVPRGSQLAIRDVSGCLWYLARIWSTAVGASRVPRGVELESVAAAPAGAVVIDAGLVPGWPATGIDCGAAALLAGGSTSGTGIVFASDGAGEPADWIILVLGLLAAALVLL